MSGIVSFFIGVYHCVGPCIQHKHEKVDMVSPTYMVEQYMEKQPAFKLEYVMLSSV